MPERVEESEQAYDSRLTITGRTITTIGCAGSLTAAFYYLVVPLAGIYLIAQIGAWIVIVAGIIWLIWLFSRGCLNAIITVVCIGLSAYLWPLFLAMIPVGLVLLVIGILRLPRERSPVPNQVAKASTLLHPSPTPQLSTRRTPKAPRMVERPPTTYRYPERSDSPLPNQRYPGLAHLPLPTSNPPEPPEPTLPTHHYPDDEYRSTPAFFLITDGRHHQELQRAIKATQSELTIISPWVHPRALNAQIRQLLVATIQRGAIVRIGWGYPNSTTEQIQVANTALSNLRRQVPLPSRDRLIVKHVKTHEKVLICDDRFCIWGSFNWLSNDGASTYRRETSSYSERPSDIALWKDHAATLFGLKDGRRSW